MAKPELPAFRIAIHTYQDAEGCQWWVASLARMEHEDNMLELGRIRRSVVEYPPIRQGFIDLCKQMVEIVLVDLGVGKVAEWQTQKPMPPSEGRG